jgi:hypothetical protein
MKKPALLALALLATVCAAQGLDVPTMKEGLWKLHMVTTSPGGKSDEATYSLCRNHAYDQQAHELIKKTGCTMIEGPAAGSKRTFTSTCKAGATTITTKAILTFSGDTQFHTESSTNYSPALSGKTQDNMVQDQTYVGACPVGMNPGDIIGADGQIRHRFTH